MHNRIKFELGKEREEPFKMETNDNFIEGLLKAHELYGNPEAAIVTVSHPHTNVFDMYYWHDTLIDRGVKCEIYTLEEIRELGQLDEETGIFTVNGTEISVFYMRAGYNPEEFEGGLW